jgi:hypothetical protein
MLGHTSLQYNLIEVQSIISINIHILFLTSYNDSKFVGSSRAPNISGLGLTMPCSYSSSSYVVGASTPAASTTRSLGAEPTRPL